MVKVSFNSALAQKEAAKKEEENSQVLILPPDAKVRAAGAPTLRGWRGGAGRSALLLSAPLRCARRGRPGRGARRGRCRALCAPCPRRWPAGGPGEGCAAVRSAAPSAHASKMADRERAPRLLPTPGISVVVPFFCLYVFCWGFVYALLLLLLLAATARGPRPPRLSGPAARPLPQPAGCVGPAVGAVCVERAGRACGSPRCHPPPAARRGPAGCWRAPGPWMLQGKGALGG